MIDSESGILVKFLKYWFLCFQHFSGSCLLLAAKFNDDMKRDKVREVIEVNPKDLWLCWY